MELKTTLGKLPRMASLPKMESTSSTRDAMIRTKSMSGTQLVLVLDSIGTVPQRDSTHGFEYQTQQGLPSTGC